MIAIAIDGPAGAGKSSLSKKLAAELGFLYIDTGALYRTIGLFMLQKFGSEMTPSQIKESISECDIKMAIENGYQKIYLKGQEVSENIRTPEVSMAASGVSAQPAVRAFLLEVQRRAAKENNVIMDGRDIGTVVLPNAELKIFLTASAEERAKRRYKELKDKNIDVDFNNVLNDVITRDKQDSSREIAPLRPAEDSIIVDTTGNSFDQSLDQLKQVIKTHLNL